MTDAEIRGTFTLKAKGLQRTLMNEAPLEPIGNRAALTVIPRSVCEVSRIYGIRPR